MRSHWVLLFLYKWPCRPLVCQQLNVEQCLYIMSILSNLIVTHIFLVSIFKYKAYYESLNVGVQLGKMTTLCSHTLVRH
jgi:hypothetical protein